MRLEKILDLFIDDTTIVLSSNKQKGCHAKLLAKDIKLFCGNILRCDVISITPKDDYIEVIFDEEPTHLPRNEEVYFRVTSSNANGGSEGFVKMTLEQAEFINKCTNTDNWMFSEISFPYYRFHVNTSVWRFVDEVEGGKANET